MLTEEQQNQCVALLLVIATSGQDMVGLIPATVKKFLTTLPPEDISKAASSKIDFSTF